MSGEWKNLLCASYSHYLYHKHGFPLLKLYYTEYNWLKVFFHIIVRPFKIRDKTVFLSISSFKAYPEMPGETVVKLLYDTYKREKSLAFQLSWVPHEEAKCKGCHYWKCIILIFLALSCLLFTYIFKNIETLSSCFAFKITCSLLMLKHWCPFEILESKIILVKSKHQYFDNH